MKSHFARYGIPDLVISDNGPQFYSEEFARFAKAWSFEHRSSSPGHQQANGTAEAAVKSAKSLIRNNKDTGRDPYLALLDKRNTQIEGMDTSPYTVHIQLLIYFGDHEKSKHISCAKGRSKYEM